MGAATRGYASHGFSGLDGRIALVMAGAGAGIGQAVARGLAEAAATVALTDRAADRTRAVAETIATDKRHKQPDR